MRTGDRGRMPMAATLARVAVAASAARNLPVEGKPDRAASRGGRMSMVKRGQIATGAILARVAADPTLVLNCPVAIETEWMRQPPIGCSFHGL